MVKKNIIPILSGLGASAMLGLIGYYVSRRNKRMMIEANDRDAVKHSHIRKSKQGHQPDFMA